MNEKRIKFIQITDTHLCSSKNGELLGMNTQESLNAVLECIANEEDDFEFFLCTGDLSQDGSVTSYNRFKTNLNKFCKKQYWLPGNHDNLQNMKNASINCEIQSVLKLGNWQIVLLNTQVQGKVFGQLAEEELILLEHALSVEPKLYTLVAMHHHLQNVNSEWLDTQKIKNGQELLKIVSKHNNVRVLLCGHVHQESDEGRENLRFISTPSTCFQFKPQSHSFALDSIGPGYRWVELYGNGRINTGIRRLKNFHYDINNISIGY
jgi:Icc protein